MKNILLINCNISIFPCNFVVDIYNFTWQHKIRLERLKKLYISTGENLT